MANVLKRNAKCSPIKIEKHSMTVQPGVQLKMFVLGHNSHVLLTFEN